MLDQSEYLGHAFEKLLEWKAGDDRHAGPAARPRWSWWPGQVSRRKSFLRKDLGKVLGDTETKSQLAAGVSDISRNLCPRTALPMLGRGLCRS